MKTEKVIYEREETKVDENGETIVNNNITIRKIPKEDEYIKLYIKSVGVLFDLPENSDKLLFEMLQYMNYRNEVVMNSAVKRLISKRLKISVSTINNKLVFLTKKGVLIRKDRGLYIINPYILARGDWYNIYNLRKTLSVKITFKEGEIVIENMQ